MVVPIQLESAILVGLQVGNINVGIVSPHGAEPESRMAAQEYIPTDGAYSDWAVFVTAPKVISGDLPCESLYFVVADAFGFLNNWRLLASPATGHNAPGPKLSFWNGSPGKDVLVR